MTQTPNWLDLVAAYKRAQTKSEQSLNLSDVWTWPKRRGTSSAHGWRISKPHASNSDAIPSPDAAASGPFTKGRR
jgi:hypothetical protein